AMLDEMSGKRDIEHVSVIDREGRLVASTDGSAPGSVVDPLPEKHRVLRYGSQAIYTLDDGQGSEYLLFDAPVLYQEHELGRLRVGISTAALQAANCTTLAAMIAVMAVILFTVFIG